MHVLQGREGGHIFCTVRAVVRNICRLCRDGHSLLFDELTGSARSVCLLEQPVLLEACLVLIAVLS